MHGVKVARRPTGMVASMLSMSGVGDSGMVQLSVRVPPSLRAAARRRAAAVGVPLRDFVQRALEVAVAQPPITPDQLDEARARLAEALDAGEYARYVEGIDDPDLADQ